MTSEPEVADPWAWAVESEDPEHASDVLAARVTTVIVAHEAQRWLSALLDSLTASTLRPRRLVVVDAGSTDGTAEVAAEALREGRVDAVVAGEAGASFGANVAVALSDDDPDQWLWLLHDDAVAEPDALVRLVASGINTPAAVVGPLLVEPRRRGGRAGRVSEAGQTITDDGVISGVVPEGIVDQGQLEAGPVLGVNACGMLVRRSTWDALGGFDADLPSTVQGLEFCWRARAAGGEVVTAPRARLVHVEASMRGLRDGVHDDPLQARRRWGLTFVEAFRPSGLSAGDRGRLQFSSSRRVAGFLLGKDFLDARLERVAVRQWRSDRASVGRLRASYASAAALAEAPPSDLAGLRLTPKAVRSRRIDETFGRFADWLSGFGDRGGGMGLDALTGDDFARDDQTKRRISPTWLLWWVFVAGAFLASRSLFSWAPLAGPELLGVPTALGELFSRYAAPVPGVAVSAGAPWTGLLTALSVLTLGNPNFAVSLLLLAAVPASFLLARRVLGRLIEEPWVALLGAGLYALVPVLTGAVGAGQLGAVVWALALPVLAGRLLTWWDDRDPAWPVAGGVALVATIMTAAVPLTWFGILAVLIVLGVRARSGWPRVAFAALAPALLLVTPFSAELARFPGRLLTGIEPILAPGAAPIPVDLLLGRASGSAPPLWVSALTFGSLWAVAVIGAVLRRGTALIALGAALGAVAVAVALTRLVVTVPPTGIIVRPQGTAWIVAMAAALVWAAVLGLDAVREAIAESTFDLRHLAVYLSALLAVVAIVLGTGWWVAAGHAGLSRTGASEVPAFIRKDADRGASRTLALDLKPASVGWALLEGQFGRLGDGERGLAFGGSSQASALAASVAERLAVGAADERIVPDLQRLGVGYLWVTGASTEQRAGISNVPGLGVGSVDDNGASWTVPASGRLVLVTGDVQVKLDPDASIAEGAESRVLLLAEPSADGLAPSVGGTPLARLADVDGRLAYAVPAAGGALVLAARTPFPYWVIVQGLLLLVLIAVAAPASQSATEARARAPRHARRGRK